MRAYLHKNTATESGQLFYGRSKTYRLTHITPPISTVQSLAFQHLSRHCGDKNSFGCAPWSQPFQMFAQHIPDVIHMAAVESIVQVQKTEKTSLAVSYLLYFLQGLQITGKRNVLRGIDTCYFYTFCKPKAINKVFSFLYRQASGSHTASAACFALSVGAGMYDPHSLLKRQRTRSPGSGYLAHAVAGHGLRAYAHMPQYLGDTCLYGKKQGLTDGGVGQMFRLVLL